MTEDIGLLDELRADSRPSTPGCKVCAWLEGRSDVDVWSAAFDDKERITASAIARKMAARGYAYKIHTVERHRNEGHRVAT